MPYMPKRPATSGTRKGNGAGWGGGAKGEGSKAVLHPEFERGNQEAIGNGPDRVAARATRESMMMVYERIAADENAPAVAQIMAAEKWLDRTEGKSIARNLNVNTDELDALDDAALTERQAELEARLRAAAAGAGTPLGSSGSGRVVN
jgi:hypothetical protein